MKTWVLVASFLVNDAHDIHSVKAIGPFESEAMCRAFSHLVDMEKREKNYTTGCIPLEEYNRSRWKVKIERPDARS